MSDITPYERVWTGRSRVKSVIALTHPTAVIIFSFATFILALFTSPGKIDLKVVILLTLAMAAAQASNGIFNEVFDRELDQIYKPWRAIPAGYIRPSVAALLATVLFCLGSLLVLAISPVIALLLIGGIGTGIFYSLKLKRTRLSWLPYLIAYPSLPVWVLAALDKFDPHILWIYLIASPFAISIHLTNQMRDFDEDRSAGIRGLAQHLGKKRAVWTIFLLLALGPLPALTMMALSGSLFAISLIALAGILHWVLIFSLQWFPTETMPPATFRSLFRRLQISCPLLLLSWYWIFLQAIDHL